MKGSAVVFMFMVAKVSNGNCIYSVMYFAYLNNIRIDQCSATGVPRGDPRCAAE